MKIQFRRERMRCCGARWWYVYVDIGKTSWSGSDFTLLAASRNLLSIWWRHGVLRRPWA